MSTFSLPKFRKGDTVKTPDGVGKIIKIHLTGVGYMYEIGNKYYAEVELEKQ